MLKKIKIKEINLKFINIKKSKSSKDYLLECCKKSFFLLKNNKAHGIINLPLNKKLLPKKYPGFTEYIASKFNKSNKETMLMYNNKFSVSPNTTHIPLKLVSKKITKKLLIKNILNINKFYKNIIKIKKPNLTILGLNPHSGVDMQKPTEEERIIIPVIKKLKSKKILIKGPISADTAFNNIEYKKTNCLVGNYHDQVLPAFKQMFKFKAINITLGLPFIRISPDHGPATDIIGKNIADPTSFLYALNFFEKYSRNI